MKVALVYDRVNKWGGAERVLLALHEIWPEAPLFTSVYNPRTAQWASVFKKVIPSFLQYFPLAKSNHEIYPLLMPLAFESFNFDDYELVISVTSEAAKGIITLPKTFHLCYCLTPTRYLWSGYFSYFDKEWKRSLTRYPLAYLRKWDKIACQRPDHFVAISKAVQGRIKNYYHRKSEIIYPPVEVEKFQIPCLSGRQANSKFQTNTKYKIPNIRLRQGFSGQAKYFLVVSRLVKYKRVDLVIETFNQLGWNLKIVGSGREMGNLKRRARQNIEFLGQLTDEELLSYYQNCEAVVYPQEEDFGLVPLEAQACGKPVIAYGRGGALETIVAGKTGIFFKEQTVESLVRALRDFEDIRLKINSRACRQQAERFSKERFKREFVNLVEEKWKKHISEA
jgi:glycosyltransferase involved in cell wall biosynthesis